MTTAAYMRSYRASQRSYGRCINCREILPLESEHTRCDRHLRIHRERQRAKGKPRGQRYQENRLRGACDNCGGPAVKFTRCLKCRVVAAARLRVRRAG